MRFDGRYGHDGRHGRGGLGLGCALFWSVVAVLCGFVSGARAADVVNASTIRGKTLCGYQGWFRCPGDRANLGWIHWSGDSKRIAKDTLTFEMWPDMSEYGPDEQYPAPGFTLPNGKQATLFSSDNARTVLRHFEWMAQYGIHGVWLQHFVVDLPGGPNEARYASRMSVLENVRKAAEQTGRAWALAYDMAGMPSDKIFDTMTREWKTLVDSGITKDRQYLHEGGLPVLMVWGFYRDQNITPELANRIIDFFKTDPKYRVYLAGGCEWEWRTEKLPGWAEFLRRFDAISPWNVGNCTKDANGVRWAATHYWKDDIAEAQRAGMLYLPVFYPGFGWDNMKKLAPGTSTFARQRGAFYWKQFCAARDLGLDTGYIAMFDEVDEGTAIFKVTNQPPIEEHFDTFEDLPSDTYLWLSGEGTKMLLGQRPVTKEMPKRP